MPRLYWYRLIETLKENQLIDIGPTIPYLIGARRYKASGSPLLPIDIETLLTDLETSDDDSIGVIQFCETIQQVVIGLVSRRTIHGQYIDAIKVINSKGRISLISILDKTKYGFTMQEVKISLIKLYSNTVKSRLYSWDFLNEEWGPIFKHELEIIQIVEI